jgi:signal transduction histidine kinase
LLQIINDLLDISKLEFGKLKLDVIPFNIHELFGPSKTIFTEKANEKGLMMNYYIDPAINDSLRGDPIKLRQALTNLLSNAIKFTHDGDVSFQVTLKKSDAKKTTVHFEVGDSGIGIAPQQIAIIFDPFMQANSGTTRTYGGTGLGLSIAKNIIELMGGKISVESTPEVGSIFSFELSFDIAGD